MIHPTAIIDPKAEVASGVTIGPYSVIGPDVVIGEGTTIGSHVVVQGPTTIGKNNRIFQFNSIGEISQDKKYAGEHVTLEIGDNNTIREFCTLNRGTSQDLGKTIVGNDNWIMAYVHIAHDCVVGDHNVIANNTNFGGHVRVDNHAVIGGLTGIHQFCTIGSYAITAFGSMVNKDIPAYVKVSGHFAKPFGLNTVGLERNGFSEETIRTLQQAYKLVYRESYTIKEVLPMLAELAELCPEVQLFINSIEQSERGIAR